MNTKRRFSWTNWETDKYSVFQYLQKIHHKEIYIFNKKSSIYIFPQWTCFVLAPPQHLWIPILHPSSLHLVHRARVLNFQSRWETDMIPEHKDSYKEFQAVSLQRSKRKYYRIPSLSKHLPVCQALCSGHTMTKQEKHPLLPPWKLQCNKKNKPSVIRVISGSPVAGTAKFPLQRVQVQSLVGELRSRTQWGTAKKNKNANKNTPWHSSSAKPGETQRAMWEPSRSA